MNSNTNEKKGLYMFTSIIEPFLKNIQSLRYYVDSVEMIREQELEERDDNFTLAMIMLLAKEIKTKNKSLDQLVDKDILDSIDESTVAKITKLIDECKDIVELSEDGKSGQYRRLPKNLKEKFRKVEALQTHHEILYNGSLILLMTYFENMMAKIFRIDLKKYPKRMALESKSVSYKMLETSNTIEEIKEKLIDEEITSIMYKSVSDWINYLNKVVKLEMAFAYEKLPELQEIIARRNLIVHNEGIVNSIYFENVSETLRKGITLGDRLLVNKQYIYNALDCVEVIGVAIILEMWLKEAGKNADEVDKITSAIYDEYLIFERWEHAKVLYEICLKCNKLQDSSMLLCKINRWQCYKWLGEFEKVKKEVEELDISACKPKYQLGVLALLDKFDEFDECYKNQHEIGEGELKEWPLFRNIREYQHSNLELTQDSVIAK